MNTGKKSQQMGYVCYVMSKKRKAGRKWVGVVPFFSLLFLARTSHHSLPIEYSSFSDCCTSENCFSSLPVRYYLLFVHFFYSTSRCIQGCQWMNQWRLMNRSIWPAGIHNFKSSLEAIQASSMYVKKLTAGIPIPSWVNRKQKRKLEGINSQIERDTSQS